MLIESVESDRSLDTGITLSIAYWGSGKGFQEFASPGETGACRENSHVYATPLASF